MNSFVKRIILKFCSRSYAISLFRKEGVTIGNGCDIDPSTKFGTEPYLITIGDNVRITGDTCFFTHDGGLWVIRNIYEDYKNADKFGRISLGNNVSVGWGVTFLPGVKVGNNVIIGAGAIITKDIPDNSVVAGVPARVIETIDEYVEKNCAHFVDTHNLSHDKKRTVVKKHFDI